MLFNIHFTQQEYSTLPEQYQTRGHNNTKNCNIKISRYHLWQIDMASTYTTTDSRLGQNQQLIQNDQKLHNQGIKHSILPTSTQQQGMVMVHPLG